MTDETLALSLLMPLGENSLSFESHPRPSIPHFSMRPHPVYPPLGGDIRGFIARIHRRFSHPGVGKTYR